MTRMIRQTMFSSGQVDVVNFKRTDLEMYMSSAQSLLNMEVGTTALARKCKGTIVQGNVTDYAINTSNIYEFIDQLGKYYLILTSDETIEIFKTDPLVHYQTISSTPYTAIDLNSIDYALDNDNLILTNSKYAPARVYITDYTDPENPIFAYQILNISPYPSFDFGDINYNNYTVSYSISGNVLTFDIDSGSGTTGFTTAWIGGQILGQGNSDSAPIGYANITNVSNSGSTTTFTATIQVAFLASGYSTQGSQYSIRQPCWSSIFGWPAKVLFYQNRLWLSTTIKQPNTVFASQINSPINFDVGSGQDTDAIVYSLAGSTGAIVWMNGGKQLEIYTVKQPYVCPQDQNSALTPGTFAARQQSALGTSTLVKPISYLNDSYYVSKTGKAIVNFHFEGVGLSYSSTNVSPQSQSLVKSPVSRGLVQGDDISQDNFVYFLNQDSTITTFQFSNESKLAALTPRDFNTNAANEARVTLIDIETVNNTLYILKYLDFTQQYVIETMDDNYKQDTCYNLTMASDGLITGLSDLNGYLVSVLYNDGENNQDMGEYIVGDPSEGWAPGTIVVDNQNDFSGDVTVGILYNVLLRPMYIFAGATESNYTKSITSIFVDYADSLDFNINGKLVPYQFYEDIQNGLPLLPRTDTAVVDPTLGYDRFQTFDITQRAPFDLKIMGIAYQVDSNIVG